MAARRKRTAGGGTTVGAGGSQRRGKRRLLTRGRGRRARGEPGGDGFGRIERRMRWLPEEDEGLGGEVAGQTVLSGRAGRKPRPRWRSLSRGEVRQRDSSAGELLATSAGASIETEERRGGKPWGGGG